MIRKRTRGLSPLFSRVDGLHLKWNCYSIRINDKWRICFEWTEKETEPFEIEIVNYH